MTKTATTTLHDAARDGDFKRVKELLSEGFFRRLFRSGNLSLSLELNSRDAAGLTPLAHAASKGHVEVARLLLDRGARIDRPTDHGLTPLHQTTQARQFDAARLLIDRGADVNARDKDGETPLMYTAFESVNAVDIARLLLDAKPQPADISICNVNAISALWIAVKYGHAELVRLFLDRGAKVNTASGKETPLHMAALKNRAELAKLLIERGADIEAKDGDGDTPLLFTTLKDANAVDVARFLLDAKPKPADPNARNAEGATPLGNAAWFGFTELAELLIDRGAAVDLLGSGNEAALHKAAYNDHAGTVRLLLHRGATIDLRNGDGDTPIGYAVKNKAAAAAQVLIQAGADVAAKSADGTTLLRHALDRDALDIAAVLVEGGADPNTCDREGTPLLILGARKGEYALVSALLKHGADPRVVDKERKDAFANAVKSKNYRTASLIAPLSLDGSQATVRFRTLLADQEGQDLRARFAGLVPESGNRPAAIFELALLANQESGNVLFALIEDEKEDVRYAARAALGNTTWVPGRDEQKAHLAVLRERWDEVECHGDKAIPGLTVELRHSSVAQAIGMLGVIKKIGSPPAFDAVAALIEELLQATTLFQEFFERGARSQLTLSYLMDAYIQNMRGDRITRRVFDAFLVPFYRPVLAQMEEHRGQMLDYERSTIPATALAPHLLNYGGSLIAALNALKEIALPATPAARDPALAVRFGAIEEKAVETLKKLGAVTTEPDKGIGPDSGTPSGGTGGNAKAGDDIGACEVKPAVVALAEKYIAMDHPRGPMDSVLDKYTRLAPTRPMYSVTADGKIQRGSIGLAGTNFSQVDVKLVQACACLKGRDDLKQSPEFPANAAFAAILHYAKLPAVQALFLSPHVARGGEAHDVNGLPPAEQCRVYAGVENLLLEIYEGLSYDGSVITDELCEQKVAALVKTV